MRKPTCEACGAVLDRIEDYEGARRNRPCGHAAELVTSAPPEGKRCTATSARTGQRCKRAATGDRDVCGHHAPKAAAPELDALDALRARLHALGFDDEALMGRSPPPGVLVTLPKPLIVEAVQSWRLLAPWRAAQQGLRP